MAVHSKIRQVFVTQYLLRPQRVAATGVGLPTREEHCAWRLEAR